MRAISERVLSGGVVALAVAVPALVNAADASKLPLINGDRVALIGATLMERDRHYGQIETVLRARNPGVKLNFRNMAWPGDTTTVQFRPLNFGTLEEHIKKQKPTVALVSYGGNEAFEGETGLVSFLEGYRRILDLLEAEGARVVLISPNPHENLGPPLPNPAAHNQNLEIYAREIEKLAVERRLPYIDLFHRLGGPTGGLPAYPLTENGIHLSDIGYWRAALEIADQLGAGQPEWNVWIAADRSNVNASGATVADLKAPKTGSGAVVRFTATSSMLPIPAPEGAPHAAVEGHESPHRLGITGLKPGTYALKIDGEPVAKATAQEWRRGIALSTGPDFDQARQLQAEVRWKNLLFFHRWRAHNGEYLYGRRSSTSENWDPTKDGGNSGNPAFPKEMAEFDRLIRESDEKASELAQPRAHEYELVRE